VYDAETSLLSSPLPGLAACERFAERVVGTLWWQIRFPAYGLGGLPRFRPGNGARRAFFRVEASGPTITLPRRYRTKAVVLHELAHWALEDEPGLAAHGSTFARVLLDATLEFCGEMPAVELAAAFAAHRVRVGSAIGAGHAVYGTDERARLAARAHRSGAVPISIG
jgi:hypothetical protein